MTEKELQQKAKEYANDTFKHCRYVDGTEITDFDARMEGFIAGANFVINLPQDFSELSDKELHKLRDEINNSLSDRHLKKLFAQKRLNGLLFQYFQHDIKGLSSISESNFRKYKGVDDYVVELVKKEMSKHKIKFLDE